MMRRQMIVLVGVFLLALAASSAQQRRHNMAIFDTLAGKTVIKLYSKGVLDTIIVLDYKPPTKNNMLQSRQEAKKSSRERTTSPTAPAFPDKSHANRSHQQDDASWNAMVHQGAEALESWKKIERYLQQAAEYRKQAERYAKDVEHYAKEAERYAKEAERLAKEGILSPQQSQRFNQDAPAHPQPDDRVAQPPHRLYPPEIQLPPAPRFEKHSQLDSVWQQLQPQLDHIRDLLRQYDWQSYAQDTAVGQVFDPRMFDRMIDDFNAAYQQALIELENFNKRYLEQLRQLIEQLQPQLEQLRRELERHPPRNRR
ncbi:MAG: hypothetical protein AA908_06285 [Chlorobi bacterium NICIL-2]|mgnify:CR=1 FL=1|jgi:hypothetical protein|nr:MAG: hypothetical protein AA908_06285 [Chlorobi bacterium NICIL-2]